MRQIITENKELQEKVASLEEKMKQLLLEWNPQEIVPRVSRTESESKTSLKRPDYGGLTVTGSTDITVPNAFFPHRSAAPALPARAGPALRSAG